MVSGDDEAPMQSVTVNEMKTVLVALPPYVGVGPDRTISVVDEDESIILPTPEVTDHV